MAASIPKSIRLPGDLLAAVEAWRDKVEAAEGVRPSWQAAVIRLLWQALKIGGAWGYTQAQLDEE